MPSRSPRLLGFSLLLLSLGQGPAHAVDIKAFATDHERPYVYAIQRGPTGQSDTLYFIHVPSEQVTRRIPIGINVTDLTVHAAEGRLYVANHGQPASRVVDLATQTELTPLALGIDAYHINAGRAGRVYLEGFDQWVQLRPVNTATGATLSNTLIREGDGEVDPTGRYYYHCDNNSSGAQLTRYDISGDTPAALFPTSSHPYGSRVLVLSPDGQRIFWQGFAHDAALKELRNLGAQVYATTLHGDVAFTQTQAIQVSTGQVLRTLPVASTVRAVSGDQKKLFTYDPVSHSIQVTLMSTIATVPGPELVPIPRDRSMVLSPLTRLEWDLSPYAVRYRVYLGVDSIAVASASPGSPLQLGETTSTSMPLSQGFAPGTRVFWRVDRVGSSTTTTGPAWSFTVSPLAVSQSAVELKGVTRGAVLQVPIALTSATPGIGWQAVRSAPWVTLERTSGVTPDTLRVSLDPGVLPEGSYQDTLWLTANGQTAGIPLRMSLVTMTLSRMLADPERPVVYALHPGTGQLDDAFLLFINTLTAKVDKVIPIGRNPTDLTIHTAEDRLYVTNHGQPLTRVVDALTQSELPAVNFGPDVYRVNAGRAGRVYVENWVQFSTLRTHDTATGYRVGSVGLWGGDGEVDPTGQWYVHSDFGISSGRLSRYSLASDQPQLTHQSPMHPYLSGDVVMSADGHRIFWLGYLFDENLREYGNIGSPVYATTAHGELAFTGSQVFNSVNRQLLATLPFASAVRAVSADQKRLFSYDPATHSIAVSELDTISPMPAAARAPVPATGATVVRPLDILSWAVEPHAQSYRVFLGTDSAAVANATAGSPLDRGVVDAPLYANSMSLALGGTYFWRVDAVGFGGTRTGAVWSFSAAPVTIAPRAIAHRSVTAAPEVRIPLVIATDGTPVSWSVTHQTPWVTLERSAGSTPDTLWVTLAPGGLPAGISVDTLRFQTGTATFDVPVALRLDALTLTQIVTDPTRDRLYALHPGSTTADDAFLLAIDPLTERIERVLPIGRNPTDMALHLGEDRLYVSNHGQPVTRVVDLAAWSERPPLALGTDVSRITAGRVGRVLVEGDNQWVNLTVHDSQNGASLSSLFLRSGDGASDPTGRWYYHCDFSISSAHVARYDLSSDTPVLVGSGPTHEYGTRNLVMSLDGQRLFWQKYVYEADLREVGFLGSEIYATTLHGDVAFSQTQAIETSSGRVLATLPVSSTVRAVSRDQAKLVSYHPVAHALVFTPMSQIAPVAGPGLSPVPADRSTVIPPVDSLAWAWSPVALRYAVYLGTDSVQVAQGTPGSPAFLTETTTPRALLGSSLTGGQRYFWRVDAVGARGTETGAVSSFTVAPVSIVPGSLIVRSITGSGTASQTLHLSAPGAPVEWTVTASAPWLTLSRGSGGTPDSILVACNATGLSAGVYRDTLHFVSGPYAFAMPVRFELVQMTLTRMVTDHERPYVYGLHTGSTNFDDAYVMWIDTRTDQITQVLPVGRNATDFALSAAEHRLYVTNHGRKVTHVIDLDQKAALPSIALTADAYRIAAGRAGRLYTEGFNQWVPWNTYNPFTLEYLYTTTVNEGDGATDPTGRWYFHCDNNSSAARISRYDIRHEPPTLTATSVPHFGGSRQLVYSDDGTRLFWLTHVLDTALVEIAHLSAEVVGTTLHGDVAFTRTQALDPLSGRVLANLPVPSSVVAVSADQTKLYSYDAVQHAVVMTPMGSIAHVRGPGFNPSPAHRSVVVPPVLALAWEPAPVATGYRVYLGTDSATVAQATPGSPSFLGVVSDARVLVNVYTPLGQRYHWRVETVTADSLIRSETWWFELAPLQVSQDHIELRSVAGAPRTTVTLHLTRPGTSLGFQISHAAPWVALQRTVGTTPDSVKVGLELASLAAGEYRDTLRITAAGRVFGIPVALQLDTLQVSMIVADPARPRVYALHTGASGQSHTMVLVMNTQDRRVEQAIPVGRNATDLSVSRQEDRLYVANHGEAASQVIDLKTLQLLPPLPLGPDVYRINAGRAGRIYTHGREGFIPIQTMDSRTGVVLGGTPVMAGDGEVDPTGHWYYHGINTSSVCRVQRFDLTQDTPTSVDFSNYVSDGTDRVLLSGDGQRLFWHGHVIDAATMSTWPYYFNPVYATTRTGRIAFGRDYSFDLESFAFLGMMPVPTTVMAVSADDRMLVYFDPASHTLRDSLLVAPLGVTSQPATPRFALTPPTPNPLRGRTTALRIRFSLPVQAAGRLQVLDVQGRVVSDHDLATLEPGEHSLPIDEAARFHAGIYFVRLSQGTRQATRRLVVVP